MKKEVAIRMHSYKEIDDDEDVKDIENELLKVLDKHGFSAQIYEVKVRSEKK